ncbi:MAG: hypothetical protein RLO52_17265 [Sandaracinaceae bacterium]
MNTSKSLALSALLLLGVGCSNSVAVDGLGDVPAESAVYSFSLRDTMTTSDGSVTLTTTTVLLTDREDFCAAVSAAGGIDNLSDVFAVQVIAATTDEGDDVTSRSTLAETLLEPAPGQQLVGARVFHRQGGATLLDAASGNLARADVVTPGSFGVSSRSCSSGTCSFTGDFQADITVERTGGETVAISGSVSGSFSDTTNCAALAVR